MTWKCLICGKPLPDYKPEYCCNEQDCVCKGQPINPNVCGPECWEACMNYIGRPFDERRQLAGIEKWS